MVRREIFVGPAVTEEFKRIIVESGITAVDDASWEVPDARQAELEIKLGNQHVRKEKGGRCSRKIKTTFSAGTAV